MSDTTDDTKLPDGLRRSIDDTRRQTERDENE
jgi:hypothetical protein